MSGRQDFHQLAHRWVPYFVIVLIVWNVIVTYLIVVGFHSDFCSVLQITGVERFSISSCIPSKDLVQQQAQDRMDYLGIGLTALALVLALGAVMGFMHIKDGAMYNLKKEVQSELPPLIEALILENRDFTAKLAERVKIMNSAGPVALGDVLSGQDSPDIGTFLEDDVPSENGNSGRSK